MAASKGKAKGWGGLMKRKSKAWRQGVKNRTERSSVPDGRYVGRLTDLRCDVRKGIPVIIREVTIVKGEYTGKKVRKTWYMDNENVFPMVANELAFFGIDVDDVEEADLPQACKEALEERPALKFGLNTPGDYQNFYPNERIELDEDEEDNPEDFVEDPDEEEEDEDEDDGDGEDEEDEDEDDGDEEEDPDEEEEGVNRDPVKGDDVTVDVDGEKYTGTVKSVAVKKRECKVDFDGEVEEWSFDDLTIIES